MTTVSFVSIHGSSGSSLNGKRNRIGSRSSTLSAMCCRFLIEIGHYAHYIKKEKCRALARGTIDRELHPETPKNSLISKSATRETCDCAIRRVLSLCVISSCVFARCSQTVVAYPSFAHSRSIFFRTTLCMSVSSASVKMELRTTSNIRNRATYPSSATGWSPIP